MSPFLVQDTLGIVFVRFFNCICVPAWRVTYAFQTGRTLAHFSADCAQNCALISNLSSACPLAQSAVSNGSAKLLAILAYVAAPSPYGYELGYPLRPRDGVLPDQSRHIGVQLVPAKLLSVLA